MIFHGQNRASGHEHWMINACDYVNVTHRLYTSRTCGRTFHLIEDLGLLHSEEYLEHMLAAFSLLLRLELRLEERVLLCAASVLSAASRVETWHIWQHKSINVDLRLATTSWGDTLDLELLRGIVNHKELVDIKLGVIKHMQGLNLTMEETVIMGCLTMLSTDRCVLQETEKVETSQWLMIEALEYLLKKNHPEEKYMLAKCISILTELRTVSALHTKEEEKFTMDWSDKIEFPPLFYEIWST